MFSFSTKRNIKILPTAHIEIIRDAILQQIAITKEDAKFLFDRLEFVEKLLNRRSINCKLDKLENSLNCSSFS